MKKFNIIVFAILILSLGACSGCFHKNGGEDATKDSLQTTFFISAENVDSIQVESIDSIKDLPYSHVIPTQEFTLSIDTLVANDAEAKSLNACISEIIFGRGADCTFSEGIAQLKDSIYNEFKDDVMRFMDADMDASQSSPYAFNLNGKISLESLDGILTYKMLIYTYVGGAHGNKMAIIQNVDLASKKILTWDAVFDTSAAQELRQVILDQLIKDHQCKDIQDLVNKTAITMLGDVYISDFNFGLGKDAVEFVYNPYEIAPYSMGIIRVKVPYENLKVYLNKDFKLINQ